MYISLPSGLMLDTGKHSDISGLEMCLQQILFVFLSDCLAACTSAHLFGWHQACLQGDLPVSLPMERCQPILGSRHNTFPALTLIQSPAESETLFLSFIKFVGTCVTLTTWAAEEENRSCQRCKLPSTLIVKPGGCYEDQWHILAWEFELLCKARITTTRRTRIVKAKT